jgi:hypothetical protein
MNNAGHFVLNITASATPQSLASAFPIGDPNATGAIRWLSLSALEGNAAVIYVGFSPALSSTNYAFRIEIPVTLIPQAPFIIEMPTLSLSTVWISGTQDDDVAVGYIRP